MAFAAGSLFWATAKITTLKKEIKEYTFFIANILVVFLNKTQSVKDNNIGFMTGNDRTGLQITTFS